MNEYLNIYKNIVFNYHKAVHTRDFNIDKNPYVARQKLVRQYAWAVPDNEAIELIVEHSPIIEIGAGLGYWAKLINECGGDIICYDQYPKDIGSNFYFNTSATSFYFVREGTPEQLKYYGYRTLFLCWPPYNGSMAADCLKFYQGNKVIYVGEGYGGCTGDDDFHEELDNSWNLLERYNIPQWEGLHDRLYIYERKR